MLRPRPGHEDLKFGGSRFGVWGLGFAGFAGFTVVFAGFLGIGCALCLRCHRI